MIIVSLQKCCCCFLISFFSTSCWSRRLGILWYCLVLLTSFEINIVLLKLHIFWLPIVQYTISYCLLEQASTARNFTRRYRQQLGWANWCSRSRSQERQVHFTVYICTSDNVLQFAFQNNGSDIHWCWWEPNGWNFTVSHMFWMYGWFFTSNLVLTSNLEN